MMGPMMEPMMGPMMADDGTHNGDDRMNGNHGGQDEMPVTVVLSKKG